MKDRSFWKDTNGIDTVPQKMIFYLMITGVILVLVAVSWNNVSIYLTDSQIEKEVNSLSVELLSIQKGYPRDLSEVDGTEGSMCVVQLSLPDSVQYLSLGVDPDPDLDGNLSNSVWNAENNTIIIQHYNGVKKRFLIGGEKINFRKGSLDKNGNWNLDTNNLSENKGIVVQNPVTGEFIFELVLYDKKYTLSHF
ncbi:hypothetical protein HWN40_03610 [Methanolobus zinderi]|uniref:Class III signal peptide-containing protein n=1 Tax=Methanolobus zinderi TaxID=536044 RepID=A0A7D5E5W5_9EURY|nr:hypothetical protein [Methanolobus zinderi]QLC49413.1 hypothetical protein HWN40_03610 [Methanolobus zinderi]